MTAATATAGTNIALVKYWGKRDEALNLPATGSLSLTLDRMGTRTRVAFDDGDGSSDRVTLDGAPADSQVALRVSAFLDRVRARAGISAHATVVTANSVPTASGLASSASGFAALALAATRAAGLDLPPAQLSELARLGSGSAARSIFGGFVEMDRGTRADGADAVAHPLATAGDPTWDVRLVVAITAAGAKALGSTAAMKRTAQTSPFYPAWVAGVDGDLVAARAAIAGRDLPALGAVAERSALRMHASALAADPAILYWNPATVAAIARVRALREEPSPIAAFFTIDAGPHVKVLCAAADADRVAAALTAVPGVLRTLVASPGPGARLVETAETSA
ncbi:MAG TPA: diphosphomevalonate decarboxylase [Polyangia bacterium]|nr:diphosphomevalonate decarboxylase [Polyangia bacterium]